MSAASFFPGFLGTSHKWVDQAEAIELLDVLRSDPVHAAAIEVKMRAIFSDQLVVKKLGADLFETPDPKDEDLFFDKFYNPPLKESIDYRTALGYVVYISVGQSDPMFDNRPMMVPTIVDIRRVRICIVIHEDERREYLVFPLGKNEPDPRYKIFVVAGHAPDPMTGRHRSLISPTMAQAKFIKSLYKSHQIATQQLARPPVVLEAVPETTEKQLQSLMTPASVLDTSSYESSVSRVGIAIAEHRNQREGGGGGEVRRGVPLITPDGETISFVSTMDDNRYYLPSGWKVATIQPPVVQSDLLEYVNAWEKTVLVLHGIPSAVVNGGGKSSDHSKGSAVDDNDIVFFQRTLREECNDLCRLATEFYLSSVPELNGKSNRSFHIKMIPFSTPTAIHRLFDNHIIHHDALKTHMLSLNGMTDDDKADGPNELIAPPLHGNENQTTAIIKSKKRVMDAEAAEREANARAIGGKDGEQTEIVRLQMELEKQKIEGQKELLDAKLEFEKAKLEMEWEKLKIDKEGLKVSAKESDMKIKEQKVKNKAPAQKKAKTAAS
jgi:hypothetical protein